MENTFGKSRYGTAATYKKRVTLKPGANIKRVLPAFGSLAASGHWFFWACQHFGWNGANKNDPDKTTPRPFLCPQKINWKTKMVEQDCAACNEIDVKKAELDSLEAELKAAKKSPKEIDVETGPLRVWLKDHNKDKKHYLNTMLENGDFELTAISNTCKKRLDDLFKKVSQKYGVDPTGIDEGVWIDFHRTLPPSGNLRDADDVPEVIMEMIKEGGKISEQLKLAPLATESVARALTECVDLPKQFTYLSEDQVNAIVASSGDPEEIDAIFNLAQPNVQEKSPEPVKAPVKTVTKAATKAPVKPVKPVTAPETKSNLQEETVEDESSPEPAAKEEPTKKAANAFAQMFGE